MPKPPEPSAYSSQTQTLVARVGYFKAVETLATRTSLP